MTLAKQRNYELVLPAHYVDVDQDEMEYVDGGGQWSGIFPIMWSFSLSADECKDISHVLYGAAGVLAAVSGILSACGCPGVAITAIAAGICTVGGAVFGYAGDHDGIKIHVDSPWGKMQFG